MNSEDFKYGAINTQLGLDFNDDIFLDLVRFKSNCDQVNGILYVNDTPICYTQENKPTLLPVSTKPYGIGLSYSPHFMEKHPDWWTKFDNSFSFGEFKKGRKGFFPYIAQGRNGRRFHPGRNYKWSTGCVICGSYKSSQTEWRSFDASDMSWASVQLWVALFPTLAKGVGRVTLTITESRESWEPGRMPPIIISNILDYAKV